MHEQAMANMEQQIKNSENQAQKKSENEQMANKLNVQ